MYRKSLADSNCNNNAMDSVANGNSAKSGEAENEPISERRLREIMEEVFGAKTKSSGKIRSLNFKIIGDGKGIAGVLVKVCVTWQKPDPEQLPESVVIKVPTIAKMIAVMQHVQPELFKNISSDQDVPLLTASHNNECITFHLFNEHRPPALLPLPICYGFKRIKTAHDAGYVVLEDLGTISHSIDVIEGLNTAQCEAAMKSIAALQAYGLYFNTKWKNMDLKLVQDGELVKRTVDMIGWTAAKMSREAFPKLFTISDEKIAAVFDAALRCDSVKANELIQKNKLIPVLVHGDMHCNNLMFRKDGGKNQVTTDVLHSVIDFQQVHAGTYGEDICRLLVCVLSADERRSKADLFIDLFYSTLKALVPASFKIPFSLADVRKSYENYLPLAATWLLVISFGNLQHQNDDGKATALASRINGAFEDAYVVDKVGSTSL